ncbi:probable inactive leucine-rich repeat receptor-like protein kinase At3g03770 isoform X1 [Cucumis sativus]|uniref:Protein kinase domain-containing protein n=1 Tax=Cucumis sativus TaxID=3659 RepID=A0A0A0LT23_CUCSA|nr:probable inactive leucine-rich repeat receptor-like protein kinase At3g03770 isoform X1 [Cucumis sativus]KGN63181.1 hypothetical protein Csa_022502 [Cucumis sativus]
MGSLRFFLIISLSWILFLPFTHQLQTSQTQILLQIRKHLEFPSSLEVMDAFDGDLCNVSPSRNMTIACQDNVVTELIIKGDKPFDFKGFNGLPILNQTLSERFSMDSFVTTLSRLSSLRVLGLISLGIWGQLPDKIHRLSSLEFLDLSSNYIYGQIPPKISTMVQLYSLVLDANFFNDTVPDWIDSLTNLTFLSLKSNRLKGQFPSSLCKIRTLADVYLSHNEISGELPDLSALANLHVLDIRENKLNSVLPVMPKGLVTLLLSKNALSGEIPKHFGQMDQLQHLDLSSNRLTGSPPPFLFNLPNITYLNLSSNLMSGTLQNPLSCSAKLGDVDISDNKLTGTLPSCLGSSSDKRMVKFSGNCFATNLQHQHEASLCAESLAGTGESRRKEKLLIVAFISGAIIVIVLLALGVFFLYRRLCKRTVQEQPVPPKVVQESSPATVPSELLANARLISQAMKLGAQTVPVCRSFSFQELREATKNFDKSMLLGEGSIGKLYRGKLENGTLVAIRCLVLSKKYSVQNLKVRLDVLSKLHHPHLVGLFGHCMEGDGHDNSNVNQVLLVYEYVSNRNYRTLLSETFPEKVLKWSDRLTILIGVAKAIHFLHTGVIPGSFNNGLKTNNILLDEHRIPKLSDYGMSIITEESEKHETKGESTKSSNRRNLVENDVYNFGYILLESLVGPIVTGKEETFLLNDMASFGSTDGRRRIVDPVVLITSSQESLSRVISITKKCISLDAASRPSFEDVLWNLQYAAQVQASADAEQKSDSAS